MRKKTNNKSQIVMEYLQKKSILFSLNDCLKYLNPFNNNKKKTKKKSGKYTVEIWTFTEPTSVIGILESKLWWSFNKVEKGGFRHVDKNTGDDFDCLPL